MPMRLIKKVQKAWTFGIGRAFVAAFGAHSVSISIGMCQAFSAILIPQLIERGEISVSVEESSWLASLGAVTNPVGSIVSGLMAEWIGRKRSIQMSSLPFVFGWAILAMSTDIYWLYAGRLITGLAAGMSTACYTYVTEISTPETRGIFQALGPICASFGILVTYTVGYYYHWTVIAYVSMAFGVFSLASIQMSPESPAWLAKNDRTKESFAALTLLRRSNARAQAEQNALEAQNAKQTKCMELSPTSIYFRAETVKPLLVLVGLFFFQEMSGMYNILYYTVNFFKDANVDLDEFVSSIVVGCIRFVMSVAAAFLIARCSRKSLCATSAVGMALSMLVTASYLKYYETIGEAQQQVFTLLPLISVLVNVFFSMIGMLPIPWILIGEMFPLEARGILSGVVICTAQCFIFLTVKLYPTVVGLVGFSNTLFVFSAFSFVTVLYVKWFLPETKDKRLVDVEDEGAAVRACEDGGDGCRGAIFTVQVAKL